MGSHKELDKFKSYLPKPFEIKVNENFPSGWYWEFDDVIEAFQKYLENERHKR